MRVSVKLEIAVLCQIPLHKKKLYKQKYLSGIIICYPQKIVCDLEPKTGMFHQFHLFSTETVAVTRLNCN